MLEPAEVMMRDPVFDRTFRPDPLRELRIIANVCEIIVEFSSLPVEVFLHRHFGERYLNVVKIALSVVYLLFFSSITLLLTKGQEPAAGKAFLSLNTFMSLFLLVTFAHWAAVLWRWRKGVRWHSYSNGLPLPLWRLLPVRQETVVLYLEPFLVFVLGLLFRPSAGGFGAFLTLAGIALFVKGQLARWRMRQKVLDVIDGQIEQEQLAAALVEDRPADQTEGFVVYGAGLGRYDKDRRKSLAMAMGGLDPEVRAMLEAKE
jgi:hypothetical protein